MARNLLQPLRALVSLTSLTIVIVCIFLWDEKVYGLKPSPLEMEGQTIDVEAF